MSESQKTKFMEPKLEIIHFECEDIITTSGGGSDKDIEKDIEMEEINVW